MNDQILPGRSATIESRPHGDKERKRRVNEVLASAARQLSAGGTFDQGAACRAHPDLMPELEMCLHDLVVLFGIGRQLSSNEDEASDSREAQLQEELEVLRRAMDKYEVLERVRYGGQGVVYRARSRDTGEIVALKLLLDGPLASERQRKRFRREIELAARLRHPNIVPVLDSGVVRGRHYYVMEYVDGVSISDYVLLNDLTPREVVRLLVNVCHAIHHAHQNGVLHRDLNPANVLVDQAGRPQVCDFGLAKNLWAQHRSGGATSGQTCGTLPYLSPEQAGGNYRIDERSDVYNLGLLLYELLTDALPYPVNGAPDAVRKAIVETLPLSLRKAFTTGALDRTREMEQVDRNLDAIAAKTLAKERNERYQSAGDLACDLERWLAGRPVSARRWHWWYRLRRGALRHRRAFWLAIVTASIVAVATSSFWLAWWLLARRGQ